MINQTESDMDISELLTRLLLCFRQLCYVLICGPDPHISKGCCGLHTFVQGSPTHRGLILRREGITRTSLSSPEQQVASVVIAECIFPLFSGAFTTKLGKERCTCC